MTSSTIFTHIVRNHHHHHSNGPPTHPVKYAARAQYGHCGTILFSSSSSNDDNTSTTTTTPITNIRTATLHAQLEELHVDSVGLALAARLSLTTTDGYDLRYGKPAIRAYRTYLKNNAPNEDVLVAATRTARQIDFLVRRQKSQQADWVRNLDASYTDNTTRTFPLTLLLDNVRSAFNVGSIFRTADACGCAEVVTTGITPRPGGGGREKLAKSALGADAVVPTRHFTTAREALKALKSESGQRVMVVGMETTERSRCYTDVRYDREGGGTVLILGNEVSGVDTEVMADPTLVDVVVEIPMYGRKNSLNVAASAPVVMYEVLRQWGVLDGSAQDADDDDNDSDKQEKP